MRQLEGKVAVVTGASRGGGKGVAQVLGDAGATVYVVGRSTRAGQRTENRPETIEETAELVTKRGGTGIPVRCDFTVDADVQALFARVQEEQGRLDILANTVWGGYEERPGGGMSNFGDPFWAQPFRLRWDTMFTAGIRARLLAAALAAPLMIPRRQGLIVNISTGDGPIYLSNLFYDLVKQATDRMSYGMAIELKPYNIAAISLSPGWMYSERMGTLSPADVAKTESTEYIGRAILALATDPNVMQRTGRVFKSGELAREYGFTDIDGRQPDPFVMPAEHIRTL